MDAGLTGGLIGLGFMGLTVVCICIYDRRKNIKQIFNQNKPVQQALLPIVLVRSGTKLSKVKDVLPPK